jgi:uncharacterized membrane protein YdjX (TVP38/TMEM64 family)
MTDKNRFARLPWRVIALFAAVTSAIIVTFVLWGDPIDAGLRDAIARSGDDRPTIAAMLFAVLSSDIVLPVPSTLASTLCGALLGPGLGFAVSFAAMSASAAVGYETGARLSKAARRLVGENDLAFLRRLHARGGRWLLLALRPVPVLSEASALFAGLHGHPRRSAYLQFAVGNAAVSAVYVATGSFFAGKQGSASLAFLVCMGVTGLCMLVSSRLRSSAAH